MKHLGCQSFLSCCELMIFNDNFSVLSGRVKGEIFVIFWRWVAFLVIWWGYIFIVEIERFLLERCEFSDLACDFQPSVEQT